MYSYFDQSAIIGVNYYHEVNNFTSYQVYIVIQKYIQNFLSFYYNIIEQYISLI